PHLHRTIHAIKELGAKATAVLNPATPPDAVEWVLGDLDMVLVMSVNPGFGGQAFIPEAVGRVKAIREMAGGRPIRIEVDGGVGPHNAGALAAAGADAFVAGSAVFKGGKDAYRANIAAIREAADAGRRCG
ncbi:MAG TPA: ribulose-phosphate 3-epimerase, partial [Caulobacteraceae bacterium]|nr:ribulose-phosphate 3-epimerase [Caulobacteraceae bacterium]